jgi:glucokinase
VVVVSAGSVVVVVVVSIGSSATAEPVAPSIDATHASVMATAARRWSREAVIVRSGDRPVRSDAIRSSYRQVGPRSEAAVTFDRSRSVTATVLGSMVSDTEQRPDPVPVVLAVDVGTTQFQVGLVTPRGVLIDRRSADIEVDVGPESHYTALAALVTEMLDESTGRHATVPAGIGATCGGRVTNGLELVTPISVPSWRDFPLRARLEELTSLGVHGKVDAQGLALAEGWLGAAQGQPNFLAVTIAAGVSGAVVLDGDLVEGESGHAGQIAHVIVEPGGRRCHCGAQGCLDAEVSGQAIEEITGRPATEPSFQIMQRTGTVLGRAAASMCNALDLSLVVVGGSIALGFGSTFIHAAQVALDEHARLPYSRGARITPSRLGEQGPLLGAGAVGWRGVRRTSRLRQADKLPDVPQPPTAR